MISVLKETATSRLKINDIQTFKAMGGGSLNSAKY